MYRARWLVSPRQYFSSCQTSQARSSCGVEEAGNPLREQKTPKSRSGSASRRRISAFAVGQRGCGVQVRYPPGAGEFVQVGRDEVQDRAHSRKVDGNVGGGWPVAG